MVEQRYLWFAPHAGLWSSFRMEHRLAEALARDGRSVTMLHCRGVLDSFCPVMSAERLTVDSRPSAKRTACRDCRHNAGITSDGASYSTAWLDAYVTSTVRHEAERIVSGVTVENWSTIECAGLPLGRWAAYTAMLHHKLPDVTSSHAVWAEYRNDLHNALLVAGAMPKLLEDYRPTHAVVYNPLYPTNRVFAELSARVGAQLVGIHAGSFVPARTETVGVYQHISASQTYVDSAAVKESLAVPCTAAEVRAVGAHIEGLLTGGDPWVYSTAPSRESAASLRSRLGLRPTSPVVVALLSSPDETRSSMLVDAEFQRDPLNGFSDIAEFIDAIRRLALGRPEIDVVLRLHPRLLPNKREVVASPDLAAILSALGNLPANALINQPGDAVSLYDLIGIASVGLNQSSSAGLEFLAFGLPVVNYDPVRQNAYPPDFGPVVGRRDPAALEAAVLAAIAQGADPVNSVKAFRWLTIVCLRSQLLMAHLVPDSMDAEPDAVSVQPYGPGAGLAGHAWAPLVRSVVPVSVRSAGARRMARSARAGTLPAPAGEVWWQDEWLERLDGLPTGGVVVEPVVRVRGTADPDAEMESVSREVGRLLTILCLRPGPGVGAIGALPGFTAVEG